MAVCRPTDQEAQTAAGPRGRRYLPKTACRAPQALEAGAFWDHRPKSLSVRSLAVLLRTVSSVFVWVWGWWPFLGWCVTEDVYSLTACPAGGHFLVRQKVTKERLIAIIRIGGIQLGEELFQLPKPQKRRKP